MRKPLVLLLTCAVALGSVCGVAPAAQAPWQDIFDGKTLDGWVQRNGKAKYTVEDEMIVGETVLNTPNSFLCTEKMYTDFVLELEFLVDRGMNSGIQIRSNSFEHYKNYRVHGYQVEIDTSSRAWSGGIYDEARRGWLYDLKDKPQAQKAFKQGQWNHYRIEAIGDRIRTWVNGVPAADLKDDMTHKGFIALQVHSSKQAGSKIRWRNIRIKDLTRGTIDRLNSLIVAIESYDFGKPRRALAEIEEEIRNVPPSSFPTVEAKLLKALRSPKTTFAGKQFVCRMLRRVGSANSVRALSEMLADEQLSHMARFALQHMPAPEAGAALGDALDSLEGDLKIGVIGSIGQRGDRKAVPAIARLVSSSNSDIAETAINALGRIGGSEAANALANARIPPGLKTARDNAYLMCADKMLADGQVRQAAAIYRKMTAPTNTTWIRIAAYRGLVQAEKEKAVPHIVALLKDNDIDLQRAAGKFITEIPGTRITEAIAERLPTLSADAQVILLAALEARADKAAAPSVAKAVGSNREPVRVAAIKALAVFGGAPDVELLAKASAAGGNTAKAARDSLGRLSGPGVTAALIAVVRSDADASVRANAIQTLIDRGETDAVQALFLAAKDSDADVRRAALKALGALGGQEDLQAMVSMLRATDNAVIRNGIERAIVSIVTRIENPDAAPIIASFAEADNMTKHHLLAILPHIGGQDALRAVRAQLRSDNLNIQKDAIRALANWPDATPLAELMEIAKTDNEEPRQILALRGYIKLLEIPANRGAAETAVMLADALAVARRPEEKKAVLAALPKYPCQEALDLARRAGRDRAVAAEADLAAKKISEALRNQSLKATASRNNGNARRALDGDSGNRWDTGRPMKPGDWFVLDLGLESTIKGLTLDSANSPNDYPRGYEVYVSFDGGSWGKPVVTGKGTKPITEIEFAKPVRARFIKILQTGSSDSWFWSIHELKVELQ